MNTRRSVVAGVLGVLGLLGRPGRALAAAARRTLLDPAEPEALAIHYIHDAKKVDVKQFPSYERGQSCQNCAFMDSGTARMRGCSIVPGRLVMATGWCDKWVQRGAR